MQLLSLTVAFAILTQSYGYNEERISNGIKTPPNLFQFVVKIGCTGTIISPRHVLSAAHCYQWLLKPARMNKENNRGLYMVASSGRIGKEKQGYTGYKAYEKVYFTAVGWNDIAILEYPEGINLTETGIEPVKLAKDYVEKKGDESYIVGFAGTSVKKHVNVKMNEYCFGSLRICGGNKTHQSQPGDSGGPMLINRNNQWYQIGVCIGYSTFDYRTRVSSYCNFIEEATNFEAKCESIFPENYYLNGSMLPEKHFEPIYKGPSAPLKLFDFVVPLYNYYYNEGCTATVISKRHLLTSARCVYRYSYHNVNKKLHLTTHSKSYRTLTGKMFPDFRSKSVHPNSNNNDPISVMAYFSYWYKWPNEHNLAVVEFPEGTDFGVTSVTLAKDYGYLPVYMDNETNIVAGYGDYTFTKDMHIKGSPPLLQHSNDVSKNVYLKYRKVSNEKLQRDEGGPTLIERNGKFYQVGVNYFSGTPNGSHTSVTDHCYFIEKVTKNEVKCESGVPLYQRPYQSTTTTSAINLPQNQADQEPLSIAPAMNQLQLTTLFILFFLYFTH